MLIKTEVILYLRKQVSFCTSFNRCSQEEEIWTVGRRGDQGGKYSLGQRIWVFTVTLMSNNIWLRWCLSFIKPTWCYIKANWHQKCLQVIFYTYVVLHFKKIKGHNLLFKSLGSVHLYCFWNKSYAHQCCIYLIENSVWTVPLWNIIIN